MSEERELRQVRLDKLARMREMGFDPFAAERFPFEKSAQQLLDGFEEGAEVRFAGRLVSLRHMGKAAFAHISDGEGRIQGYFRRDDLPEGQFEAFKLMDIGDHIGVDGKLFLTRTGEKSIEVASLTPLSKALQTLPLGKEKDGEQWYGLTDVDQRYRHRHLDLIANHDSRKALLDRSRIVAAVRQCFYDWGFLEVETPILQLEAGGAAARPFLTHFNAYDLQVKLRISLELYLKRIICGDVPKVFELGRVFRNEGVSNRHNPEFTLLEWYEAYTNLEDQMERVEGVFRAACLAIYGTTERHGVDFGKPWHRLDLLTAIQDRAGIAPEELQTVETAKTAMSRVGLPTEKEDNLGGIIEKLLERFVEPHLIEPTFIVGYPIETSPLAKKDPLRPGFTRRFEGYVLGREVCNAFSEINDPIDQRERFDHQLSERDKGDDEAHPMDEEFIYALECGMPPCGGVGIGIDRMVMLLTGADHVREALLFPMMKPDARD
jgi:lysyl-tRNA synthetase class 2